MKQSITGPVAIAVIVVISIAILGFLYTQFIQEKKITPEETRKHMMGGGGH